MWGLLRLIVIFDLLFGVFIIEIFVVNFLFKFCDNCCIFRFFDMFFVLDGLDKYFFISCLVWWMVSCFFVICCVIFICCLFFNIRRVWVWFIFNCLVFNKCFMLLFNWFKCSRLVIVVCDLLIIFVICWWVRLNLFCKCFSVCVFFIVFRFLCWMFLINVMVIVLWFFICLIK